MIFNKEDSIHLNNLTKLLVENVELNKLSCMDVSKAYKSFEWLQNIHKKFNEVAEVERELLELKEAFSNENSQLINYIDELKSEMEELKKPKRRTRKKSN